MTYNEYKKISEFGKGLKVKLINDAETMLGRYFPKGSIGVIEKISFRRNSILVRFDNGKLFDNFSKFKLIPARYSR